MRVLFATLVAAMAYGGSAAASPLVTTDWLAEKLEDPSLRIVDIRSGIAKDDEKSFLKAHIPGAVYANYLEAGWRTKRAGVVGMLPTVPVLESLIGGLGISNDHHVVIVESGKNETDFGSAARIYWTFQTLGHDNVSILEGGFKKWLAEGRDVASGSQDVESEFFEATLDLSQSVEGEEIEQILADGSAVLVDGRPYEQYVGKSKHNAAKRAGRIPTAINIDQKKNFDRSTGLLKDVDQLAAMFPEVEGEKEIISYCNTGHWASTNWFVMSEILGRDNIRMYDESMVGWTQNDEAPVVTGEES